MRFKPAAAAAIAGLLCAATLSTPASSTGWGASWFLNEPAGSTQMYDSSGNANTGTLGAGVTAQGGTYHFTGRGNVTVPDSPTLNPGAGDFTFSTQFRMTGDFTDTNLVQKGQHNANGGEWKLEYRSGWAACTFEGTIQNRTARMRVALRDGKWHVLICDKRADWVAITLDAGTSTTRRQIAYGPVGDLDSTHPVTIGGKEICPRLNCDRFAGDMAWVIVRRLSSTQTTPFGTNGDIPVPADYDRDGKTDLAVFRPSTAVWYVLGRAPVQYGMPGDVPVPADYNGDGKVDLAVFRPSTGVWYIMGRSRIPYGTRGDIPVPADYNGDGWTDPAVFRPSTGSWYVLGHPPVPYGTRGDIPVPADYDGDRTADLAVFRPSTGFWFVLGVGSVPYGTKGDIPVPADYDRDGRANLAVFRPSTGYWYVLGVGVVPYGQPGDVPLPSDYNGVRKASIGVFRPSNGNWYLLLRDL